MTGTLKPFKDPKYLPLEEALEQVKAYQAPTLKPEQAFDIQEFDDFYSIIGATYGGKEKWAFDWKKELLDRGNAHTSEEWIRQTTDEGWMVPSAQIYTATVLALYKNRSNLGLRKSALLKINDVQNMLMSDFANGLMMTRTTVNYASVASHQPDIVSENFQFLDGIEMRIGGKDKALGPEDSNVTDALLGSSDAGAIAEAYKMLCSTFYSKSKEAYYIRYKTSYSSKSIVCAVAMGMVSPSLFLISADQPYDAKLRARGVRVMRP
jgi:hypothetical protein